MAAVLTEAWDHSREDLSEREWDHSRGSNKVVITEIMIILANAL